MLAIAAAIVFGIWLLLDLFNTNLGAPDLFNFSTMASLGLLLLSLYLAGVGSGPRSRHRQRPPVLRPPPRSRLTRSAYRPAPRCAFRAPEGRPVLSCRWTWTGSSLWPRRAAYGPRRRPTGFAAPSADSPLPVRMRPASLDELVGQEHLLAPGAPLRQLVTGTSPMSVILWGPPGTGKTTIAHLVARATDRKFVALSALSAGVKDVRAVIDTARRERRAGGPPTVLFIDEVHRFSKTQQDSLLAAVEDRTVTLLAATTENPYFSVISPLLSRCVLLTLQALDDDDVRALVRRAVTDERGLGGARHALRRRRGPSGTPRRPATSARR